MAPAASQQARSRWEEGRAVAGQGLEPLWAITATAERPAGLEPPSPGQLLVLSCQRSRIKYLCLIYGTQEPLSQPLLKTKGRYLVA